MKFIKISPLKLTSTQKSIDYIYRRIIESIQEIYNEVQELNKLWEGDAHDSFVEKISKELQKFEESNKNIQLLINFETNAEQEYQQCFNDVESMIEEIKV